MAKEQLDFLAIGDVVIDNFIELNPDNAWIEKGEEATKGHTKEICMSFGDKIPYKDSKEVSAVGNSPNASVSAHRLGLNAGIATNIGSDEYGKRILAQFEKEGITTEYVTTHEGLDSNYHFVLRYGPERTILVKHTEYPYKELELDHAPKWIYLSSLAENSLPFHDMIADWLDAHPETKLALQPGTFQMKLGKDKLKRLYEHAELFFCNVEEAQRILETKETDLPTLLKMMQDLGPKMPVITDGPNGAYVLDENGDTWHQPMYPDPAPPVDRTGAGDSFASTFTSALILGMKPEEALGWGPINSMSVVQHIGAQEGLLTREKLEEYLANAHEGYKATKVS
jgi:ribokinase